MQTHKATIKSGSGEITTWIIHDLGCMPFRVVTFKMDAEYAKEYANGHQDYNLNVEVFDNKSLEWKPLVRETDFSDEELEAMIEGGSILGEIKDYLATFFGIRMYND